MPEPLPTDRQLREVHRVREEAVARAWAEAEATVELARRQAQARVQAAKAQFEVRGLSWPAPVRYSCILDVVVSDL